MRYKLAEDIDLCGWQLLPFAIRYRNKIKGNFVRFIDEETFDVLKLCDGALDLSLPLFSDRQRKIADVLCNKLKVIEPINDDKTYPVNYTYYDNRFMKTVHWSITGKCNAKCKHCYMSAPTAKYGELDHETIMKIAQDIINVGTLEVSLTGGETLVRKDLFDIIDLFLKNKVYVKTIYTNGFLLDQNLLNKFIDRGIKPQFSLSFDGVGYHDYLRGIPGAEKMTNRALKLLQENGFKTDVEMCLFQQNKHTLRETINHLAKLGVSAIKTNPVSETELWIANKGQSLNKKELIDTYFDYIPYYYKDKMPMTIMLGGFFRKNPKENYYSIPSYKLYKNLDDYPVCGHARATMYIGADGRASSCMGICDTEVVKKFPLVQEIGIKKCLTDSTYINFVSTTASEIIKHNPECETCEYKINCAGGCRASALDDHPGDLFAKDEWACYVLKNDYVYKIKKIVKEVCPSDMLDIDYFNNKQKIK